MHEILDVQERLQRFLSVLQVEFKFPLEGLSEAELAIILDLLQFRAYAKGDYVYKQGHTPKGVYWMRSGRIKFTNSQASGEEHTHFIVHGDQFFGYRTVISSGIYHLSVEVMETSEIGFIPADKFMEVLEQMPLLMKAMLKEVCASSMVFIARSALFSFKSVPQRLGIAILLLQDKVAKLENIENPPVLLSRNELASYIGTSVEVVVRQLKKLEKMSLIELKGKLIYVKDLQGLLDMIDASDLKNKG
jgi:CRP-like cAMP-binding protein